jgi:hypothetical protein
MRLIAVFRRDAVNRGLENGFLGNIKVTMFLVPCHHGKRYIKIQYKLATRDQLCIQSERNQAEGRIAHHHAYATVPHIVALLGFSFHSAKINIISEISKIFRIFLHFLQNNHYLCNCYLPMVAVMSSKEDGVTRAMHYIMERRY